jgi:alanine-glyoxylate transaminase/serine-glyoxylate transaminase/serine-pyruvate transaminase
MAEDMPRTNNIINPSRSLSSPTNRLSLISRHLVGREPLNTPYTTERLPDTVDTTLLSQTPVRRSSTVSTIMSSQPEHPTLLIPGPIEFDDAVLQSMSHFRFVSPLLRH